MYWHCEQKKIPFTICNLLAAAQNPDELILSESTANTISVTWGNTTNPAVTGYEVIISQLDESVVGTEDVDVQGPLEATFTGLNPGTIYEVTLFPQIPEETAQAVHSITVITCE